jgi:UDP-glucose 4-epimerase
MSTIWITGGKGFIGRNLARYVATQRAVVVGIGHGMWPAADAAKSSFSHWTNGEIESANLSQMARMFGPPDAIFHLAGGSSVGLSFQNPQEDFSRTVETTARLLEWVRIHAALAKIVCVSSAAVYGAGHRDRIAENVPVSPYSPYGFNKSMMELVSRSYAENFGLQVALVRLFSVYGAELEKQLLWDICCKLDAGGLHPLQLGGHGTELRDWIHVADASKLLWLVKDVCSAQCTVLNGGTGIGTAIKDVAEQVCRAWNVSADIHFSGIARPGDPEALIADISRAKDFGFEPVIPFARGISETVDWFRRNKGASSRAQGHYVR